MLSELARNPCHIVPPSIVRNVRISTPDDVSEGAVPPAQSTDDGQLTVCDPPFVNMSVKLHPFALAVGFEKVNVLVLVSTVALMTLPFSKSMSCVPPPVPPIALCVSP